MKTISKLINEDFSTESFYVHQISNSRVFDIDGVPRLLEKLRSKDELAAHLSCSPDYLIVPRKLPPKDYAIYIRTFESKILLEDWEKRVYKHWYPIDKFLLYAPLIPQYIWLSDYLKGKVPKLERFVLDA